MLYIDKTVHILFVAPMRKVTWCHQVLSFYFLLFATTQVCQLHFFRSHSCYFCHLGFFHTSCNGFVFKTFARSRPWPFPYFQPSPSQISENYKMSDYSEEVWGRVHKRLFFRVFLRNLEKECCFRIWQSVHENFAELPSWDGFWEERHFELNWATLLAPEL